MFGAGPAVVTVAAPAPGGWKCLCCEKENDKNATSCSDCMVSKPADKPASFPGFPAAAPSVLAPAPVTPAPKRTPPASAMWTCGVCKSPNPSAVDACNVCGIANASSTALMSSFSPPSTSRATVALSQRHRIVAERFFAQRQRRHSFAAASPRTPTAASSSGEESNNSSFIDDVTFNVTPKRVREYAVSPDVLAYQRKTVVRGAAVPAVANDGWKCPSCTHANAAYASSCELCLDPRP